MESLERQKTPSDLLVVATACKQWGPCATREVPAVIAVWINWQLVRDRRWGVWDGGEAVVPISWGTLGEGRSLSSKESREKQRRTAGSAMSLSTRPSVQKLQTALHDKAKGSPNFRFMLCNRQGEVRLWWWVVVVVGRTNARAESRTYRAAAVRRAHRTQARRACF